MNSLVPIFQGVIEWIYGFTGDYGAAIVVLTLVIRMILIPVNILQRRQVEKQREVRREAEKIKEKFKKNERKQQEELQKLYERKGLGMGSCFMSLLQLPIMISLYNATRSIAFSLINGSGNTKLNYAVAVLDGIISRIGIAALLGFVVKMGCQGFWYGDALAGFIPIVIGMCYYISWRRKYFST